MKKLTFLLVVCLTISCSKDNNTPDNKPLNEPIFGQWKLVRSELVSNIRESYGFSGGNIIFNFQNDGKLKTTGYGRAESNKVENYSFKKTKNTKNDIVYSITVDDKTTYSCNITDNNTKMKLQPHPPILYAQFIYYLKK